MISHGWISGARFDLARPLARPWQVVDHLMAIRVW
jgi:hypothetical protein